MTHVDDAKQPILLRERPVAQSPCEARCFSGSRGDGEGKRSTQLCIGGDHNPHGTPSAAGRHLRQPHADMDGDIIFSKSQKIILDRRRSSSYNALSNSSGAVPLAAVSPSGWLSGTSYGKKMYLQGSARLLIPHSLCGASPHALHCGRYRLTRFSSALDDPQQGLTATQRPHVHLRPSSVSWRQAALQRVLRPGC